MKPLWPHQERGLAQIEAVLAAGERSICVTSPTGGGKTRCMVELALRADSHSRRTLIYTNRKLLTRQTSGVLSSANVDHGMLAAEYPTAFNLRVQIASMQTIVSRVVKRQSWELYPADLVIVDECHQESGDAAREVLKRHMDMDAAIVGFTATPVGLGSLYKRLLVAGTNSELRRCGALLPATTYAPDEPDMEGVERDSGTGEFRQEQMAIAMLRAQAGADDKTPVVFGRILKHYWMYNPQQLPALLFAPDVASSRWLAQYLSARGVPTEHIDGETPMDERNAILDRHRQGITKIITNRFVLREGVDLPHVYHGIFCCAFGALSTYLQAGGRILRAHPGYDHVVIQDHGGSWHRFGSLNWDRDWTLGETDADIARRTHEARKNGTAKGSAVEPIVCVKCHKPRMPTGTADDTKCPYCGHVAAKRKRMVIQTDGTLKAVSGPVTKRTKASQMSDEEKAATKMFWMAVHSKRPMTFSSLDGWFYKQYRKCFPSGAVKLRGKPLHIPDRSSVDWDRRIIDVYPFLKPRQKETANAPN